MADKNVIVGLYEDQRWQLAEKEDGGTRLLRVDEAVLRRWQKAQRDIARMEGEIIELVGEQQLAELKAKGLID